MAAQLPQNDNRICISVEVPNPVEMARCQRNAALLQGILVGKVQVKRKRREAAKVVKCLGSWKPAGPLVAMFAYLRAIKKIQGFMRRSLSHLAETRAKVEADWIRIEREIAPPPRSEPHAAEKRHEAGEGMDLRRHRNRGVTWDPNVPTGKPSQVAHVDGAPKAHCTARRDSFVLTPAMAMQLAGNFMTREERHRRRILTSEMKKRRKKYVQEHRLWLGDMGRYWRDVHDWRMHRKDCISRGVKPVMDIPSPPPVPSHLPSEEEMIDIVRHAQMTLSPSSRKQKAQASLTPKPAGRVGRLAAAASADTIRKDSSRKEQELSFTPCKKVPTEGGHQLCEEVSNMLAPTAAHPVPVGNKDVHRPVCPSLV